MIVVGRVLRPQGIKGQLKILPLTDDLLRLQSLKTVWLNDRQFDVVSIEVRGGFAYAFLGGVSSRNDAELLRDAELCILREQGKKLKKGEYFFCDMIGCSLQTYCGQELGEIVAVDSFGAADVITVKMPQGVMRFPFLKVLDLQFDVQNKSATVLKDRLDEVAVIDKE